VGKLHEHRCVDGRIMLNWILKIQYGMAWTGFIWRGLGNKWQDCREDGSEFAASAVQVCAAVHTCGQY
jgi:hypothetical protein